MTHQPASGVLSGWHPPLAPFTVISFPKRFSLLENSLSCGFCFSLDPSVCSMCWDGRGNSELRGAPRSPPTSISDERKAVPSGPAALFLVKAALARPRAFAMALQLSVSLPGSSRRRLLCFHLLSVSVARGQLCSRVMHGRGPFPDECAQRRKEASGPWQPGAAPGCLVPAGSMQPRFGESLQAALTWAGPRSRSVGAPGPDPAASPGERPASPPGAAQQPRVPTVLSGAGSLHKHALPEPDLQPGREAAMGRLPNSPPTPPPHPPDSADQPQP